MASVEPDVRFRHLAQVFGIRAVVHDAEMSVRPPGLLVIHLTMAYVIASQFEGWPWLIATRPAFFAEEVPQREVVEHEVSEDAVPERR